MARSSPPGNKPKINIYENSGPRQMSGPTLFWSVGWRYYLNPKFTPKVKVLNSEKLYSALRRKKPNLSLVPKLALTPLAFLETEKGSTTFSEKNGPLAW